MYVPQYWLGPYRSPARFRSETRLPHASDRRLGAWDGARTAYDGSSAAKWIQMGIAMME
jgi:hypothetical protein